MALVCVYDICISAYNETTTFKRIINSNQVCKIFNNDNGTYCIQLSSRDSINVNQNDVPNIVKAFGYDDKGIEFYMSFIDN